MKNAIWKQLEARLKRNEAAILHIVTSHKGSSPGKKGAKMLQFQDGTFTGTIGGGIMEYDLQKKGLSWLDNMSAGVHETRLSHRQSAEEGAVPSGLICAGSQVIHSIILTNIHLGMVQGLCRELESGNPVAIGLSKDEFLVAKTPKVEEGLYWEQLGANNRILIYGEGHIGQALATICKFLDLDFRTIGTPKSPEDLPSPSDDIFKANALFAVIVTSNAMSDSMCLKSLLTVPLVYCGIMGSKSKLKHIFQSVFEGNKPKWYETIHAPIGMKMPSHSPEEIAISIAAELITVLNESS